jgi:N-acetylmuramoyl-L-alanine amidase
MRSSPTIPATFFALAALFGLSGCSSEPEVISVQRPSSHRDSNQVSYQGATAVPVSYQSNRNSVAIASRTYEQARVRRDFMPKNARGRTGKSMRPRYITIHSTQNWSKGADPWRHSLALKNSKLGRLSWHYTVDQRVAVQHLPTNEQGRHADIDGPGNHYSIGIEMCEHPGNSRNATLDRTARLTAWLMYKNDIPISHVVPHYHWPRWGRSPANKNCPHYLLENGRPGKKWRAYLAKIKSYHDQIVSPRTQNWASR